MRNPARIYTEQAIQDNQGRIELFKGEVEEFIRRSVDAPEGLRLEAEKARISAVKALEDYQRFLQSDLLPRSSGDWRLGPERYHKKFSLALQTDLTPESVVTKAESAFKHSPTGTVPAGRSTSQGAISREASATVAKQSGKPGSSHTSGAG